MITRGPHCGNPLIDLLDQMCISKKCGLLGASGLMKCIVHRARLRVLNIYTDI